MIITILSLIFYFSYIGFLCWLVVKLSKIVQFLVEPLIKKQSISPRVSGFFLIHSDRDPVVSFCLSNFPS